MYYQFLTDMLTQTGSITLAPGNFEGLTEAKVFAWVVKFFFQAMHEKEVAFYNLLNIIKRAKTRHDTCPLFISTCRWKSNQGDQRPVFRSMSSPLGATFVNRGELGPQRWEFNQLGEFSPLRLHLGGMFTPSFTPRGEYSLLFRRMGGKQRVFTPRV
jgi:hypothetical protein